MILYPAIDLEGGRCVRLCQGDRARATVFSDDPAGQARAFVAAGAEWLHVVDLDGAFAGRAVNAAAVSAILASVTVPVQLGGGVREMAAIEAWLGRGVARVVLGTAAVRDPALVRAAARAFPGRIAVAIDAREGRVAVAGWAEATEIAAADLARACEDAGVAALIHTEIARDGMLAGPDLAATRALAEAVALPVILSGGIGGAADLEAVRALAPAGVAGVIVGRALYDGRLGVAEALAALAA